ncbi:putative acyl-CoA-binding protein [Erysiphe necator]|nr:putative acyl-CoA-binding protein [Erysiphe necator]
MATTTTATGPSDPFAIAADDSTKLTEKPNSDELLELYSLYKIATGEDITKAPEVGMFDLKGKSKRKAWQAKVDTRITPEDAKAAYIALVENFKVKYKYDPNKVSEKIGG